MLRCDLMVGLHRFLRIVIGAFIPGVLASMLPQIDLEVSADLQPVLLTYLLYPVVLLGFPPRKQTKVWFKILGSYAEGFCPASSGGPSGVRRAVGLPVSRVGLSGGPPDCQQA